MNSPAHSRPKLGPATLVVVLVFTLASALAINTYTYALGDNGITIPFTKSFVNPALYPGDYMVAQREFYYTYVWNALGTLNKYLGISLPVLFFGTFIVALYFTFLGIYLIALTLFERHEVAVLSMLFALFSRWSLADVRTIELTLNTRGVATPFLLFGIFWFLEGKTWRSFLCIGLAYLAHPLTASPVLAILVVAALMRFRRGGFRQLLIGIPVFLLVASPILVWRLQHTPPGFHLFSADATWLEALHRRSPHHMFPLTWSRVAWTRALVTLVLFGIGWRYKNPGRDDRHRVIWIGTWMIVAMCAIGVYIADIHPMGLAFVTQPPRSFQFMEYFAILYIANFYYGRMAEFGNLASVLVTASIAGWIVLAQGRRPVPLLTFIALTVLVAAWPRIRRTMLTGAAFTRVATCLACVAALTCYVRDLVNEHPTFAIDDDPEYPYIQVELWARTNTDVRDGFIVPPYQQEEFRVYGERTVYADMEDGGLMNANPAYAKEWLRRMKMLGLTKPPAWSEDSRSRAAFASLDDEQLRRIADEMRPVNPRVFLVWPTSMGRRSFPEKYRNSYFVVYEVNSL